MFAVFLHESMNPFHQTVTSFPTVIYTVLLIVCVLYWAIAMLGLVDLEILDIDLDGDIDSTDSAETQSILAGVLLKLGLNGVPLTIVLTIIAIIGWLICYYTTYFGAKLLPDLNIIKIIAALVTFVIASYITVLITAQVIKPLRALFSKLDVDETKHIIGQTVVVRSSVVNTERGEAFMNDGGAGVLLNIRTSAGSEFKKGDHVVVIEKLERDNHYKVIAESEFSNQ